MAGAITDTIGAHRQGQGVGSGLGERLLGATAFTILLAVHLTPLAGNAQSSTRALVSPSVSPSGAVQLKVRRLSDALELVIEGTGPGPQLVQSSSNGGWQGQLTTAAAAGLRYGPQRLSLPEAGLEQVSLSGSGTNFQIEVMSTPGLPMKRPVVSADGQNLILTFSAPAQASLQTLRPNLNQPGAVPQAAYAPPLQPRAVAPPLGDMAIGTMVLRNTSYVAVRGPRVTMTLRNAPARDALMTLAQMGGYGFVYVDEQSAPITSPLQGVANSQGQTSLASTGLGVATRQGISLAFVNEDYSRALNAALLAAGLTGKLEGNMLIIGLNVGSKGFGSRLSKVYRLNQVSSEAAADYLANLGATVTKTNTISTSVTQGVAQTAAVSGAPTASTTQSVRQTTVETYGASRGPLLGLGATTDNRLGTITLVGDASVVAIAEQYLKQLDLRQRQVALSVKILDVNLNNDVNINNSFAARWGNTFIVSDSGNLLGAFGNNLPATAQLTPTTTFNPSNVNISPAPGSDFTPSPGSPATGSNPAVPPIANPAKPNPGFGFPDNSFNNFLQATILSENTKVVANPTLILQESSALLREPGVTSGTTGGLDDYSIDAPIGRRRANEGVVRVGVNVPTKVSVNIASGGGPTTCSIDQLSTSGLVLGARIEKIDDNGFVTFALSPSISAVESELPSGAGCPPISILRVRRLDTGVLRVRDGQTLILTGVISDFDRQVVRKWPVVGDMPLIGQFFRASSGARDKRELVIMVTPRIINDETAGVYGYGYAPSTQQSRQFMGQAFN